MPPELLHQGRVDDTSANPPMMADYYPPQQDGATNFQPSLAVVLGVLAVMFSLTFSLLLYAKCGQRDSPAPRRNRQRSSIFSPPATIGISGLSQKAVESLPFFRFGTLGGSKEGLECAVCLSKYRDTEILRLLPKCRHAFHIDCVDQWLAGHSTCPLCRSHVSADDASLLTSSSRFVPAPQHPDASSANPNSDILNTNSSADEGVELFVEREEQGAGDKESSSIFSIGSSFRKLFGGESGTSTTGAGSGGDKALHKHNHKILVSDVLFKNRWSNVSSSDLMVLKSEMMLSRDQFSVSGCSNVDRSAAAARSLGDGETVQSIREEMEWRSKEFLKRDSMSSPTRALLNQSSGGSGGGEDSPAVDGRRSISEITVFSRFRELGWRNCKGKENSVTGSGTGSGEEEKQRKIWLPIARKTVDWFAKREETECSRNRKEFNII